MLKYSIISATLLLVVLAGYIFISEIPNLKLETEIEEKEYLAGEKIKLNINITNKGMKAKYFFIDLKSDLGKFVPETVFLYPKANYTTEYQKELPKNIQPGIYEIKISVKTRKIQPFTLKTRPKEVAKKIINIKVKELEKPKPVLPVLPLPEKKPEPFIAKLNFISTPENFVYETTNYISISVENISPVEGRAILWIDITGPENSKMVFSNTLSFMPNEKKEKTFEFFVDGNSPPGEYFVSSELRDFATDKFLFSDVRIVELNDLPPKLTLNQVNIKTKPERQVEVKYEISDDIEVKDATLLYYDQKTQKEKTYSMILSTGSKKQGIWSCTIYPEKKVKQFKYYVLAIDNRDKQSKSSEQTVTLIK
jgi:hypothetical protein